MIALEAEILNLLRKLTKWNQRIFTTSGTFEVPAGVRQLFITAIGGGGGGAGAMGGPHTNPYYRTSAGGGGGAGCYIIGWPFKVPYGFANLPVVIGAGGEGTTGRDTSGHDGGSTIFANSIIAKGGFGARYVINNDSTVDGYDHFACGGAPGCGTTQYISGAGTLIPVLTYFDSDAAYGGTYGHADDHGHDGRDGNYMSFLPLAQPTPSISGWVYNPDGATYLPGSGGGGGGYYYDNGTTLYVEDMGNGGRGGPSQVLTEIYYGQSTGGVSDTVNGWAGGGGGASSPFGVGGNGGNPSHPNGYPPSSATAYGAGGGGAAAPPTDTQKTIGGNGKSGWLMVEWMG